MADDQEDLEQIVASLVAYEARLSPLALYRHKRTILVRTARNARRIELPWAKELLRRAQVNMVKTRYEFHTGVKPGGD